MISHLADCAGGAWLIFSGRDMLACKSPAGYEELIR